MKWAVGLLARLLPAPTALVVPVAEAQAAVSATARPGEAPVAHVTVLWPFLRLPRRRDRERLRRLAAAHPAFDFRLSRIETFPDVVYLEPQPSDQFREITEAFVRHWPHLPPYGGAFAEVVPHLTLRVGGDLTDEEARAVQAQLPIQATAREILLIRPHANRWSVLYRVPLATVTSA